MLKGIMGSAGNSSATSDDPVPTCAHSGKSVGTVPKSCTNDLRLAPGEDMPVRESQGCVNIFSAVKRPGRVNQMTSTDFPISRRGQLSADQVPFIGK